MTGSDLLQSPLWEACSLGRPIPDSKHAVSVALPRWRDVVGYEEKSPEVMQRLASGYPRFVVHPLVEEAGRAIADGEPCLPFPSRRVAELALDFVRRNGGQQARIAARDGMFGVLPGAGGHPALKAFWQHTGLIVSSRQAEAWLDGKTASGDSQAAIESLRRQIAGFYGCSEDDVFLAPTGMASIFTALRAVLERSPGRPTAQLGFPYVDTLKLQQKFGPGGILLHHLATIESKLRSLVDRERLAACFCEIPGNPLLGSVDLSQISPLLREHRVPLVVDDVVATAINVDVSRQADLVVTSLTKFVVGTGDAMGGALICNRRSPLHDELQSLVRAQHEDLLWGADAVVLDQQALDFPRRMRQHNQNGLFIAERLRQHPAIERVWYPKWEFAEAYEAVRRPTGGWGALLTFLPRNAEQSAPAIYDRLALCKGPSLGTVFTLACPFTLLAHYTELEWAEACGVSRFLIRLSVGLEDPEELWKRLDSALNAEIDNSKTAARG